MRLQSRPTPPAISTLHSDTSKLLVKHLPLVLLHIPVVTARGHPGNIVRNSGALRDVSALLRAGVGLLSCGELGEDRDGAGGHRETKQAGLLVRGMNPV